MEQYCENGNVQTYNDTDRFGDNLPTYGGYSDTIVEHTHTCYQSTRGARHAWGHGCGECPSCALRKRGFEKWRAG